MRDVSKYELMRHALGVQSYHWSKGGDRWKKPYRNHFVAGGDDAPVWYALVEEGFAKLTSKGNPITGGDPSFCVTEAGAKAALAGIVFKKIWGYGLPENP